MTRGLVTSGLVLALAAVLALPALADDDLGAPPAGTALPPGASPPTPQIPAPPPPRDAGVASRNALPPPPPPPPPPPALEGGVAPPAPTLPPLSPLPPTQEEAHRLAEGSKGPETLEQRYDEADAAALARETAVSPPCTPPVRILRRFGGDPMKIQDPTRFYGNAYFGASVSFLPNLGAAVEIGGIYQRTRSLTWSWEGEFTWQFLDDETFADDGNPAFDGWYQLQAGVKIASHPLSRRHWTLRWGGVWFYADGEPNIVEEEGHYFGAYVGFGFETDITCNFSMGPELSGMFVIHEDGLFEVVPQFNWHFIWSF